MMRQLVISVMALLIAVTVFDAVVAQESAMRNRVVVQTVTGIMTLYSVGREPCENASHTYVLTHGLGGVDDRFFKMGQTILAREPTTVVLVVDWSSGADRKLGRLPNPLAAGNGIDLTGDMLGAFLIKLHKKNCFDPAKTTFIGESFGNCVNHRAALVLRKNGLQKAQRALVLNPAPSISSYETPLFTVPFKQSIVCVTNSCLDTRRPIANKMLLLKAPSTGAIEQHTYGMRWLKEKIDAGIKIESHFIPRAE